MMKTILSLFDYSGRWSRPYRLAGYRTVLVDIKHRDSEQHYRIMAADREENRHHFGTLYTCPVGVGNVSLPDYLAQFGAFHGILAAPPCTDFSVSGAQYWPAKDADGRTEASAELVRETLDLIHYFKPAWWALENPVGRLNKCVPELAEYGPWYFQPHWFGDPWTKKTGLWGTFNRNLPRRDVEPIRYNAQGSWTQSLGGKSERTKELRSMTPEGFARAFFEANP